jgi:hypothetical protein
LEEKYPETFEKVKRKVGVNVGRLLAEHGSPNPAMNYVCHTLAGASKADLSTASRLRYL